MLAKMRPDRPDRLKMHPKAFGGRSLGELIALPQTSSRKQRVLLLREGERGKG